MPDRCYARASVCTGERNAPVRRTIARIDGGAYPASAPTDDKLLCVPDWKPSRRLDVGGKFVNNRNRCLEDR